MVINQEEQLCAGCNQQILDRYLFQVVNKKWHCECLKCVHCQRVLNDKCWTRLGNLYCQTDYYKLFIKCNGCKQPIEKEAFVRKVNDLLYHVNCFQCSQCSLMLNSGDQYVLHQERLFCIAHYPNTNNYWPCSAPTLSCNTNSSNNNAATEGTLQSFDSTVRLRSPALLHQPATSNQSSCISPSTIKCESSNALAPCSNSSTPHPSLPRPGSPSTSLSGFHHLSLVPHNQQTSPSSVAGSGPSSAIHLQQLQSPPLGLLGPKPEHPVGAALHLSASAAFHSLSSGPNITIGHSSLLSCYGAPSTGYDSSELISAASLPAGCSSSSMYASLYSSPGASIDMSNSASLMDTSIGNELAASIRGASPLNDLEMENGSAPTARKGRPRKRKQLAQLSNGVTNNDLESLTKALHEQNLNNLSGSVHLAGRSNDPGASMSSCDSGLPTIGPMPMGNNGQRTKRMRTSFKHHQLKSMKSYFADHQNPDAKQLKILAAKTGLTKRVLQVWFQNSRAKWRRTHNKSGGGGSRSSNGSTATNSAAFHDNGLGDLQLNDSTGSGAALPNGGSSLSIAPSTPGSSTCLDSPASHHGYARQFSTPSPTSTGGGLMDSGNGTLLMAAHHSQPSSSGSLVATNTTSASTAITSISHPDSYSPTQASSLMRSVSPGLPQHLRPVGSVPIPVTSVSSSPGVPLSFAQHPTSALSISQPLHPLGLMASLSPSTNQLSTLSNGFLNSTPHLTTNGHIGSFVNDSLIQELY